MQEMQETLIQFLCWEDTLEKEMATHSSILAWKIPRTEEPGGLQSMGSQRVRPNWAANTYMPLVNCILFHSTGSPVQNIGVIPRDTAAILRIPDGSCAKSKDWFGISHGLPISLPPSIRDGESVRQSYKALTTLNGENRHVFFPPPCIDILYQ